MEIDTNFIRVGLADQELYSFLCCSSVRMPASGKNKNSHKSKTARSNFKKLVSNFLKVCRCKHMWKETKC